MSRVRIYDLTKGLKAEQKKILEVARRMGVLSRLPHGFRAGGKFDMTDSPDRPDKDKPQPRKPSNQDDH
jgi:hypothetical protein